MARLMHEVADTVQISMRGQDPEEFTIQAEQPGRFTDYNCGYVTLILIDFAKGSITHTKKPRDKRKMLNNFDQTSSIMLAMRIGYPHLYLVNQGDVRMDVFGKRGGMRGKDGGRWVSGYVG